MLLFLLGAWLGATVGVVAMCLFQVSGDDGVDAAWKEDRNE